MAATIELTPSQPRAEAPGTSAAIRTTQLRRSFESGVAVESLDLLALPGEVLTLLGPNGAGKTTTVRMLNGILAPDSGSSEVLGIDPAVDGNEVRRRTGVLTENAGLDDRLTALENLVAVGRIRGMSRTEARDRSMTMLERFDMGDRADQRTHGFSTGQRKRVALARALLHDPKVLFLDEPTSGLDPAATRDVMTLIDRLAHEQGRTVVLATHFLGEAGQVSDRVAVLDRGRLLAFGTPADLATELWSGLTVNLDLGTPATPTLLDGLRSRQQVKSAEPLPTGAKLVLDGRDTITRVVADLVAANIDVFGATALPPTLEDIYFAVIEQRGRP